MRLILATSFLRSLLHESFTERNEQSRALELLQKTWDCNVSSASGLCKPLKGFATQEENSCRPVSGDLKTVLVSSLIRNHHMTTVFWNLRFILKLRSMLLRWDRVNEQLHFVFCIWMGLWACFYYSPPKQSRSRMNAGGSSVNTMVSNFLAIDRLFIFQSESLKISGR